MDLKYEKPEYHSKNEIETKVNKLEFKTEPQKEYNCYFCPKHFDHQHQVEAHESLEHENDKLIDIKHLPQESYHHSNKDTLNLNHGWLKLFGQHFMCDFCEEKFICLDDLENHMKNAHKEMIVTCEFCERVFDRLYKLTHHVRDAHKDQFRCNTCAKNFVLKDDFDNHIQSEHGGFLFACDSCNKSSKTKITLKRHTEKHHRGMWISSGSCTQQALPSEVDLDGRIEHGRSEHGGFLYACDPCRKGFQTLTSLKRYSDNFHGCKGISTKLFNQVFPSKDGLVGHNQSEHGNFHFACSSCHKSLITKEFEIQRIRRDFV